MQQNMGIPEKAIPEIMADILDGTTFDLIKILYIDANNQLVQEAETLDRTGCEPEEGAFSFSSMEKIIQVLGVTRETIVLSNPLTRLDQTVLKKINNKLSQEIIIPLFNGYSKIAGVIYLAKQNGVADIMQNEKYFYLLSLLTNMLERNIFQAKIQENLVKNVLLLCEIINAKEPMLISNLYAVSYWAIRIGKQMDLPERDLQKLQLAALMHNLGKIYIDETLLSKPGPYTQEDSEAMKRRIVHSYEIALRLGRIYDLEDIPEIILKYQERMDGKGYPSGLREESIPLLSRILGVATALTSMMTNKSYRKAREMYEVIHELKSHAGTQFDRAAAEAAMTLLINKKDEQPDYFSGIGNYATLSITLNNQESSAIQLWGQVRKNKSIYVFNPIEKIPSIDKRLITGCALYLDVNEQILKFKPDISQILTDRILLEKIEPQGEEDAFSIRWFLEGVLITNEKVLHKIYINLLGGDYLDFYIFNEENPGPFTSGIVKIALAENKDTLLPGIITFRQQMNEKMFFRFKYSNVSESERQQVFSAMFRKQLEMKSRIKGLNNN